MMVAMMGMMKVASKVLLMVEYSAALLVAMMAQLLAAQLVVQSVWWMVAMMGKMMVD